MDVKTRRCEDRVITALSKYPLEKRCGELTSLLQELSMKELEHYLTTIVEHVFGFGCQIGWGLRCLTRGSHTYDYAAVRHLLGPEGPLLRLIYRLLTDGSVRYEFPVDCLPSSTQKSLRNGVAPSLYTGKFHPYGGRTSTVQLNSFEFYMFHFAYYVTNPAHAKAATDRGNLSDALYFALLEDYLRYFLPTDGNALPSLPGNFHDFSPPPSPLYPSQNLSFGSALGSTSVVNESRHKHTPQRGCLLKKNVSPGFPSPVTASPTTVSSFGSPPKSLGGELWCSEIFVAILAEFWLGRQTTKDPLDSFEPSQDHMKTVRVMVKYLHYFASRASLGTSSTSFYSCNLQFPLDDLRRRVIPQLVRKRLYTFLKQALTCWPLDASFRLPLETWLSFVQPWRYANNREADDHLVNDRWRPFIQENLLFYTGLFNVLLPRFFHMDLSSRSNAFMLYRVTKVLSQEHLLPMIMEVESSMGGTSTLQLTSTPASSALLRKAVSASVANAVRQHMSELEEPGYIYKTMFSDEVRFKVNDLLKLIAEAQRSLEVEWPSQESKAKGWWAYLTSFFNGAQDKEAAEARKGLQYLKLARDDLCHLFKLQPHRAPPKLEQSSAESLNLLPSMLPTCSNLSVLERSLDRMGPRKNFDVRYQGNPDTEPIRSYEFAFLVRVLHLLSCYLNEKYGLELQALYHGNDLVSHMVRQLLRPPTTFTKVTKTGTIATAVRKQCSLPARVCLRPLANRQMAGYVMALFFLGYTWDCGPLLILTVLFLVMFAVVLVRALIAKHCSVVRPASPGVHQVPRIPAPGISLQ